MGRRVRCPGCAAPLRVQGPPRRRTLSGRTAVAGWCELDKAAAALVTLVLLGAVLFGPLLRRWSPELAVRGHVAAFVAFAEARYQQQGTTLGLPEYQDPWGHLLCYDQFLYSCGANGLDEHGQGDDVPLVNNLVPDERFVGEAPLLLAGAGVTLGLAYALPRRLGQVEERAHELAVVALAGLLLPLAVTLTAVALLRLPVLQTRFELPFLCVPPLVAVGVGFLGACLAAAGVARLAARRSARSDDRQR
ncbi:MAG: hypothetical protein AB7N76_05670 [Planctomycetota bacterium]